MATASAGRPALVSGKASSMGQFRLPQFVDSALKPNATSDAHQTPALLASKAQDAEQMAQATRPPLSQNIDRTPSVAPARTTPQGQHQVNSSPAGGGILELVELTSNLVHEGILGPNKDGRVRNPVPSKLKGKTDNKQGNFGVMHMGLSPGRKGDNQGKDAAAERDAAARRTSENTASRARAMQSEKYVPPKRKGLEGMTDGRGTISRGSPFSISREDSRKAARPLAPDETKVEQARLLTLLRTINPVTVVDQICKAVAYFGGIPGAPPPEDGIFPESANTRETGAMFIGWLAEIFPEVGSARSPEVIPDIIQGKKKSRPSKGKAGTVNGENASEAPNSRNGYGFGPAVSAPGWGLPQSLALVNTPIAVPTPNNLQEAAQIATSALQQAKPSEQQPNDPLIKQDMDDSEYTATGNKRRRGRPKGSRNKGRADGQGEDGAGPNGQSYGTDQGVHAQQAPQAQMMAPQQPPQAQNTQNTNSFVPANKPAVPKPSPALQYTEQSWQSNPQQSQQANSMAAPAAAPVADELSPEERAVLEAFRNHGPDSMGIVPSPVVHPKSTPEVGQKRKRAPPKPKAAPNLPPTYPTQSPQIRQNTTTSLPLSNNNTMDIAKDALQWGPLGTAISAPVAPPPAKRIRNRKPKPPPAAHDPPSRTQTASVVSSATPPIPPSVIPDSTAGSSQQSIKQSLPQQSISQQSMSQQGISQQGISQQGISQQGISQQGISQQGISQQGLSQQNISQQSLPQSMSQSIPQARPPAEGLEAHYERFQSFSNQQNGRSHTPTLPQQQVRQQPKPASVPPKQSTPQMQKSTPQMQKSTPQMQKQQMQSQQMQQQKSQQSNQQSMQREEPKPALTATARPASTNYYNQRTQSNSSYAQQYPSHQASQLYGTTHQASPQMSSSNTYRNSNISQGSTQQFAQAESSYRTASPHTIPQPSPSFSQADTSNYRTSSLSQASPSFSQAETSYRAPSANSIAQPSPSYTSSRPHSQSQPQQSHYSHFSDSSSYIDLPTLNSLGHVSNSSTNNVGLGTQGYGQQSLGVGLGASRSTSNTNTNSNSLYGTSSGSSNSLYGTSSASTSNNNSHSLYGTSSSLGNGFDNSANDLLRGVSGVVGSRSSLGGVGAGGTGSVYGASGSVGLGVGGGGYHSGGGDELQERLLRGLGRR